MAGSDNGVSGVPRSRGLKAVFSEKFINSLAPRRVARWGARHARRAATVPVGGPIRQVTVDDARLAFGEDVMLPGKRLFILSVPDPLHQPPVALARTDLRPLQHGAPLIQPRVPGQLGHLHAAVGPGDDDPTLACPVHQLPLQPGQIVHLYRGAAGHQRLEPLAELLPAIYRQRPQGQAMKGVVQVQRARALGSGAGELECSIDRVGPRIGEKDGV